jgi:hypothetical protein
MWNLWGLFLKLIPDGSMCDYKETVLRKIV